MVLNGIILHAFLAVELAGGVSMSVSMSQQARIEALRVDREASVAATAGAEKSLASAGARDRAVRAGAARSGAAAEALRAAMAMRPSEAARIDILKMSTTAASTPVTTVNTARFPEDVWRGCKKTDTEGYDRLHQFLNHTAANMWRDGPYPVVLEEVDEACLTDGRPTTSKPALTWIASVPPDRCAENATEAIRNSPSVEHGQWPGLEAYHAMWPANDTCATTPCALSIHMHGLVDSPLEFGYPGLVFENRSVCAPELGTILFAPEFRMPHTGDLSRVFSGPGGLTRTILPLIESFIRNNSHLIDHSRVYVTGLSNGAEGALSMALLRPDLFALVVATDIAFQSIDFHIQAVKDWSKVKKPRRLQAIVITEGQKDVFGIMERQDNHSHFILTNVTTLHQATGLASMVSLQLRIYQGVGHGTWDTVWFQWPDLYEIMFTGKQRLAPPVQLASWALQLGVLVALALISMVMRRRSQRPAAAAGTTESAPASSALSGAAAAQVASTKEAAPGEAASAPADKGVVASPQEDTRLPLPKPVPAAPEGVYTLHGIFEDAAAKRPNAFCLKAVGHRGLTYSEVQHAVEKCSAHVAALDDKLVGICAHRSYEMIIAVIAVLRTGKAYVPVEPDFPAVRVDLIFSTAEVHHVLVPRSQHPLEALATSSDRTVLLLQPTGEVSTVAGDVVESDHRRVPESVPDDAPAYVMFTSGSTGKPKGCVVPHRGSAIYSRYVGQMIKMEGGRTMAFKVPFVFDPSVRDIFMCMFAGNTLAIAPPGAHVEARELIDFILQERVGYSNFAPTLLVEFVNHLRAHPRDLAAIRPILRFATCGGEALLSTSCVDLKELLPDIEILNVYGPTECSIDTSHFRATPPMLGSSTVVPIGYPHPHIVYKVFDPEQHEGRPVDTSLLKAMPDGQPGELFIGGDCLAIGYLGEPEKTAAVFFNDPEVIPRPPRAASKYSMYKTGDLVLRRSSDGACEFLGRVDFQVKVHGVRIECEEVSSVIKTHPDVNDAFVTKFEGPDGDGLVAYVVPAPTSAWSLKAPAETFNPEAQQACNELLAQYLATTHLLPVMNPSVYVLMRNFPLSTTGKVDRKALPDPLPMLAMTKATGVEVVDSLGRVRKIRTEAEAVFNNVMLTVLFLNCIGILLCHWLPTDISWSEPSLSPGTRWVITFMQQASNFNFLALFVLLGYRTRRQSIQDTRDDIMALFLLLIVIGWPYWMPQLFAGMATFHRYTCVTLLACHLVLSIFQKLRLPPMLQGLLVFGAALFVGTEPVKIPFIPEGATSIWKFPGLLLFEPQFFGSMGLQLTMVLLFLGGFHGAPAIETRIRAFTSSSTPRKLMLTRCLAGLVFFLLVQIPMSSTSESLATTSDNVYMSLDVMGDTAYRTSRYPFNLLRWILTVLSLLVAVGQGHESLHAIGRNFVGVYLVHMYFSLDMLGMVRGLQVYGMRAQLPIILYVPLLYCVSVGALAQDAVAAAFRGILRLQEAANALTTTK